MLRQEYEELKKTLGESNLDKNRNCHIRKKLRNKYSEAKI